MPRSSLTGPLLAALVCTLVALAIFGPHIADPANLVWIQGDAITNQFGWNQYRADPDQLYPIVTARGSWPLPMPLAIYGTIPLFDLLFKLLGPVLPLHVQYLGPVFIASVALQAVLGWALLREVTPNGKGAAYRLSLLIGAVLFGTAPVLLIRFYYTHISLALQWPILWSLLVYLRSFRRPFWPNIRDFSAVAFITAGINPYTLMMALLVYGAFIVRSLIERQLDWPKYVFMVIPVLCGLAGLLVFGFLEVGGLGTFPTGDFGFFSANFFALIDPTYKYFSSSLIPDPGFAGPGQYEGFGYLGVGVMFAIVSSLLVSLARQGAAKPASGLRAAQFLWPLVPVVVLSWVWAMSNVMAFGAYVVEVPLPELVLRLLENFRSSGRFIAVVVYVLMFAGIAALIRQLQPKRAALVLSVAAVLQIIDLAEPYAQIHQRFADRYLSRGVVEHFVDPVYQGLGARHDTLLIVPPWQCREWHLPKEDYSIHNFMKFSHLAMGANLRSNSFYGGRLPVLQGLYHCEAFLQDLVAKPAGQRTAYLFTTRTFRLYGQHVTKTHSCDFADDMFICRGDGTVPGLSDRARRQLAEKSVQ